ncbi:hypothetical protein UCRPA7_8249 [Phaeoacremonium minimum UCRPA7]|uniref:Uncharacterized protein n=1 Tax=Phaeoacremonium minimum (strain UCR-PA7) TaxID=1286976 RepID=R8BAI1_PHAM7|nr:hypothetical protein UCRPA7_8249 [Phaeoacremonium minimum UCRPA7]EON96304.1 hypothetical protein UCRPA7_8249 [Phaeoacremonium minimum UCRPA7]
MTPSATRKRIKKLVRELFELQRFDIPMTTATLVESKYLLRNVLTCEVDRHSIPKFILCQLQDQRLTDTSSPRVALTAALSFIISSLPAHLVRGSCFPVLFSWQRSLTHRTHVVFAFVDIPMASQIYTIEELLNLRSSYQSNGLASVANKDRELAEIIRGPSYNCVGPMQRNGRKTREDSSTESDEVVFKGNVKRRTAQVSTQPPVHPAPIQPVPYQADLEWRYRGRTDSEIPASEPLSAPSGLNAQQNEGFQRFYKAVVSPTHVRVTAGGRIVPNPRGSSPTTKRAKDSESSINTQAGEARPTSTMKEGVPMMAMPSMHPFFTGFPQGFPPFHPLGMMPIPMGTPMPNGLPLGAIPVPAAHKHNSAPDTALKETNNKKAEENQPAEVLKSEKSKTDIKISPPEQFDPTKPFFYNGLSRAASYGHPVHPSSANPPISSIRPSDISKKQMESLRGNLKYHEDQLQYNRHQIDEKDMENKIQLLKNDIERFERVYQAQLDFEAKHYPKADRPKDDKSSVSNRSLKPSKSSSSEGEGHQSQPQSQVETKPVTEQVKDVSRVKTGLNKSLRAEPSYDSHSSKLAASSEDRVKKSSFPSDAALAPPFQPRSVSLFVEGNSFANFKDPVYTEDQLNESHRRLLAAGAKVWDAAPVDNAIDKQGIDHRDPAQATNEGAADQPDDVEDRSSLGIPYLVGTLPPGMNPQTARDTDYVYVRELTDDERRSRYLHWGQAPHSVRRGLPKFDGKDFYPPSPIKEPTSDSDSPTLRTRRIPYKKERADAFRHEAVSTAIPVSSRLPNAKLETSEGHAMSFSSQVGSSSDDFKIALEESKTPDESKKSRLSKIGKVATKSNESLERRSADHRFVQTLSHPSVVD